MSHINLNCISVCLPRNAQQEEASASSPKPLWLIHYHCMHLTISLSTCTCKVTLFFALECETVTELPIKDIDQQTELESDLTPTVEPAQDDGNDGN